MNMSQALRLTEAELAELDTLAVGQAADLKVDTGFFRVWLSRCGIEDGETQPIQYERLTNGRWVDYPQDR